MNFGWTPEQISQLTIPQILIYLDGIREANGLPKGTPFTGLRQAVKHYKGE